MPIVHYPEIRDVLRTGDICLFSGKGPTSSWIKRITKGRFSHIGRILVPAPEMVLLWESTTLSNLVDLDTGRKTKGVQVVPLSERLAGYDGDVAIRRLFPEATAAMASELFKLRHAFKGRAYEKNPVELVFSAYDGPLGEIKGSLKTLFCSELLAAGDHAMGTLDPDLDPPHEYVPSDYDKGGKVDQRMAGCSYLYGNLIEVV